MSRRPLRASRLLAFATLTAIAALAACGGGGGSASTPGVAVTAAPIVTAPPAGSGLAPASFSIQIPGTGASGISRRVQAVSASTATVSFTLLKTDAVGVTVPSAAVTFDVSSTSALCVAGTAGARACTVGIAAPLGNDIYSVQTFDKNGAKLGSSAVNLKVLANVANTATISLGGTLAGVVITTLASISFGFVELNAGLGPTSARAIVIGVDNAGHVILTPDTFSTPITLSLLNADTLNTGSTRRHPRVVTTAAPTPTLQVSVTSAATGAVTSMTDISGTSLSVTSPGDIVNITALTPQSFIFGDFALFASVGPLPAVPTLATAAPGTTPVVSALEIELEAAVATPPPVSPPTPCPANYTGTAPNCVPPVITFLPQTGLSGFSPNQLFQFASPATGAATITVSDTNGGVPFAGTMSIAPTTPTDVTACAAEFAQPAAYPVTATLVSGQMSFVIQTFVAQAIASPPASPQPLPTGGAICNLTATDSRGVSAKLEVVVNNITGSVQ
jgi:hypothetical protein